MIGHVYVYTYTHPIIGLSNCTLINTLTVTVRVVFASEQDNEVVECDGCGASVHEGQCLDCFIAIDTRVINTWLNVLTYRHLH